MEHIVSFEKKLNSLLSSAFSLKKLAYVMAFVMCAIFASSAFAQFPGFDDPAARQSSNPSGGLVAVDEDVDGGAIPAGAAAQVVVLFRNEGSQPVETGTIRLYPSSTVSAEVTTNQCQDGGSLPSGAECAIALTVSALQVGPWRVEMLMSHSGRTRLVTTTLSGVVETVGDGSDRRSSDVEALPEEINFGSVNAGQALIEPIILRNITSNEIEIEDIYIDANESSGYELSTECDTLSAGQACIATVKWSPSVRGPSSGVLIVKHTGPAGITSVTIEGDYNPETVDEAEIFPEAIPGKGLLVSSQTEIDFGSGIVTSSTITVSLVNAGDTPVAIDEIKISGSDSGLSFNGSGCRKGVVLEPVEACPLTLSWSPTRVGTLLDDIQILHDGARGILVLPVRGASDAAVSQDQRAIVLGGQSQSIAVVSSDTSSVPSGRDESREDRAPSAPPSRSKDDFGGFAPVVANPAGILDGFRITSFAKTRAIVSGPGGSRIVFDGEEIVLGGVPWLVDIQNSGIQFETRQGQRVLLLFDRSLSSTGRIPGQSGTGNSTSSGSNGASGAANTAGQTALFGGNDSDGI